jgi:hypothetical protein
LIRQTRFASALELETTWSHYLAIDNHSIPQRALGPLSPVQALKQSRIKQPELFDKRVYKQAGLGSYPPGYRTRLRTTNGLEASTANSSAEPASRSSSPTPTSAYVLFLSYLNY